MLYEKERVVRLIHHRQSAYLLISSSVSRPSKLVYLFPVFIGVIIIKSVILPDDGWWMVSLLPPRVLHVETSKADALLFWGLRRLRGGEN